MKKTRCCWYASAHLALRHTNGPAAYAGYGNYRLGKNSEGIRNLLQNRIAHKNGYKAKGGTPIFKVLDIAPTLYNSYQTRNSFTTW